MSLASRLEARRIGMQAPRSPRILPAHGLFGNRFRLA